VSANFNVSARNNLADAAIGKPRLKFGSFFQAQAELVGEKPGRFGALGKTLCIGAGNRRKRLIFKPSCEDWRIARLAHVVRSR